MPIKYETVVPDNGILYKYYGNLKYGLEVLLEQKIYFSKLDELNDPFEWRARNLEYQKDHPKEHISLQNVDVYKNWGMFCLTECADNILMWMHYANGHRGFAIGFDSTNIHAQLGHIRNVKYQKDLPEYLLTPKDEEEKKRNLNSIQTTKNIDLEYEKEIRFLKEFAEGESQKVTIRKEAIKELVLGAKIESETEHVLAHIYHEHYVDQGFTVLVKQAELSKTQYKIDLKLR